jgi:hypothetical protein
MRDKQNATIDNLCFKVSRENVSLFHVKQQKTLQINQTSVGSFLWYSKDLFNSSSLEYIMAKTSKAYSTTPNFRLPE